MRVRARQAGGDRVDTVLRAVDHPVDRRVGIGPDRRDQEQLVGQPVEDEDRRRAHEHHVGQVEPRPRGARDALDEADRFISEEADERCERLRQRFGNVEATFGNQIA